MKSQLLLCLSFIIFINITMSEGDLQQVLPTIKHKVGESARIWCSPRENINMTMLCLTKGGSWIFTLWTGSELLSRTLHVSRTYDNLIWTQNQTSTESKRCNSSPEPPGSSISCPDDGTEKTCLYDGDQILAFLSVSSAMDYKARIQLAGTVRNLSITINDLREGDRATYQCVGVANNLEYPGAVTDLVVVKATDKSFSAGAIVGIVLGVLAAVFFIIGGVIWVCKKLH